MINIQILDERYSLSQEEHIEAICLFGSYARGDNDSTSDMDILIIIDDCDEDTLIKRKKIIEYELSMPSHWISVYRKSSVVEMSRYGSYFLWHVKIEGILLFSKTLFLKEIFDGLPSFTKSEDNLIDYLEICEDIKKSVEIDETTITFELSTLASIIRNTCIAHCFLCGKYIFGKYEPVEISKDILGSDEFPFLIDDYKVLYHFRISVTRGINSDEPLEHILNKEYVVHWVTNAEQLIELTLRLIQGRK